MLNERLIVEISQRVRTLLRGMPGYSLENAASRLDVPVERLAPVLQPRPGQMIDTATLIDVLAAVVHEYGVDSTWLLTGEYGPGTHRTLEDEGPLSLPAVRTFVADQIASAS
ncbi:MAG TPA: hypothetical protein VJV22_16505 [Acidobacteriaceae bacterium]|nr:hypothetical protein [Acidobacteriaceae bacterium]